MLIIKIEAGEDHCHAASSYDKPGNIPKGWAVLPPEIEAENFPYGEITAEKVNGRMIVTSWMPMPIPDNIIKPTSSERMEAQMLWTILLTDTLLEDREVYAEAKLFYTLGIYTAEHIKKFYTKGKITKAQYNEIVGKEK